MLLHASRQDAENFQQRGGGHNKPLTPPVLHGAGGFFFGEPCVSFIFSQALVSSSPENIEWTRNTDTDLSVIASSAEKHLHRVTRIRCSNAALTHAVDCSKRAKQKNCVRFAALSFCHQGRGMKHVLGNAEQSFACLAEILIQWSKSGSALPSSAALLLQGVCETKQTKLQFFSGIRSSRCALILRRISNPECLGITTEKGVMNGA